jgi:hypothetical protein
MVAVTRQLKDPDGVPLRVSGPAWMRFLHAVVAGIVDEVTDR